ncbi:hypothetical protein EVJ55_17635 [Escherichia coli]|nr:hypothetical protein [Escherichia coli]
MMWGFFYQSLTLVPLRKQQLKKTYKGLEGLQSSSSVDTMWTLGKDLMLQSSRSISLIFCTALTNSSGV